MRDPRGSSFMPLVSELLCWRQSNVSDKVKMLLPTYASIRLYKQRHIQIRNAPWTICLARKAAMRAVTPNWGRTQSDKPKNANSRDEELKPYTAEISGNFGVDVDCYVLDDDQKTAVISLRGIASAEWETAARLTRFLSH